MCTLNLKGAKPEFLPGRKVPGHLWRDVEVVVVGDVVRVLFARALVWADVDPHGGGLGA